MRDLLSFKIVVVLTWLLTASPSSIAGSLAISPQDGRSLLIVRITGIRSHDGQLRVAIFNSETTWLVDRSAVYATVLDVTLNENEWRTDNVPHGDYALAAFHDRNGDGKLGRNMLGIPTEPYGFSNNARRRLGPARWKDAKFSVMSRTERIEVAVK